MTKLKNLLEIDSDLETSTASGLVDLFEGTIDELRQFANIKPHLQTDTENSDMKEATLLDFEAHLLQRAARFEIRTKEDMKSLMDIWRKTSSAHMGDDVSPSDRIVMNIFRHMSDDKFSID